MRARQFMSNPVSHPQTASQTVGPFYAIGLTETHSPMKHFGAVSNTIVGKGQKIKISGKIFDRDGMVIKDALVEIYQTDGDGRADASGFIGLARSDTGKSDDNSFSFNTVKPGARYSNEAPHIAVAIFMRGLLLHTYTRIYFSDEEIANEKDPVFRMLPLNRSGTLIAERESSALPHYQFNIYMQGESETLFFRI